MAGYVLEDDYMSNDFFSMFNFFTDDDPTHGYVNYVDQETAYNQDLIRDRDGAVYLGVDHNQVAQGRGRNSVRLSSKKAYNYGLIVLDLKHMPGGQCGSWPAFWMLGPDWPHGGEIDIIEGVNSQLSNEQTLHTSRGCSIDDTDLFLGELTTWDCDVNAPGQSQNHGCKIVSNDTTSYGQGFNEIDGGVYATEWSSELISIWFFPRHFVPDDLSAGHPDPTSWGKPSARFEGGCEVDNHFKNHSLIFDVTFCGDWAGNAWGQDSHCSSQAYSCEDFVQNRPEAFADTNWQINSLRVYRTSNDSAEFEGNHVNAELTEHGAHFAVEEDPIDNEPIQDEASATASLATDSSGTGNEEAYSLPNKKLMAIELSEDESGVPVVFGQNEPQPSEGVVFVAADENPAPDVAEDQNVESPIGRPVEMSIVTIMVTVTGEKQPPNQIAASTPRPNLSTFITSVQGSKQKTVSALELDAFASFGR